MIAITIPEEITGGRIVNRVRMLGIVSALFVVAIPARAEEPRAVIERAVKLMGGEELLGMKGASFLKFRGYSFPEQVLPVAGEQWIQSAKMIRLDGIVDLGGGRKLEFLHVINDGKGWRKKRGKVVEMPAEDIDYFLQINKHDETDSLLPLLTDKGYTLTPLKETKVDGRASLGVKATHKDKPDSVLYFDKETGYFVKVSAKNKKGKLTETILSDYREVGREECERVLRDSGLDANARPLLAFLRRQVSDPAKVAQVPALIRKLGDHSFGVREQAVRDLVALEWAAVPLLQLAQKKGDAEVIRGASACLALIEKRINITTLVAAVRHVGWTRPEGGAEVLLALLPRLEEAIANEARAALVVYAEGDGKPDAALVKALDDTDPVRRAAARAVLGKDGGEYLNRPGRILFVRGLKQPMRAEYYEDDVIVFETKITELCIVNRLDPKLFEKPLTGK